MTCVEKAVKFGLDDRTDPMASLAWSGRTRSGSHCAETVVTVDVAAEDKTSIAAAARKLVRLLGDLETYVSGQSSIIIDNTTARRREQMRWSPRGLI